jgi:hypothetical protein
VLSTDLPPSRATTAIYSAGLRCMWRLVPVTGIGRRLNCLWTRPVSAREGDAHLARALRGPRRNESIVCRARSVASVEYPASTTASIEVSSGD